MLLDPGFLGSHLSASSFVEFTLAPNIIKKVGTATIDHLVVLQPSQLTFEAMYALSNACQLKRIYMPFWDGTMSRGQKRAYARFMESVRHNNIQVMRIRNGTVIELGLDKIQLIELPSIIKSKGMSYHAWYAFGMIQNMPFSCASGKLKAQAA
jgi:hypothetical protein